MVATVLILPNSRNQMTKWFVVLALKNRNGFSAAFFSIAKKKMQTIKNVWILKSNHKCNVRMLKFNDPKPKSSVEAYEKHREASYRQCKQNVTHFESRIEKWNTTKKESRFKCTDTFTARWAMHLGGRRFFLSKCEEWNSVGAVNKLKTYLQLRQREKGRFFLYQKTNIQLIIHK